jgi:hypothetical protein
MKLQVIWETELYCGVCRTYQKFQNELDHATDD